MAEIQGLSKVLKNFEKAQVKDLKPEINASALSIQTEAKRACPVGTPESTGKKGYVGGRLRSSIRVRFKSTVSAVAADIYTDVYYAPFVEFGTSKMAARPFLTPAFIQEQQKFYDRIRARLQSQIDSAGGN